MDNPYWNGRPTSDPSGSQGSETSGERQPPSRGASSGRSLPRAADLLPSVALPKGGGAIRGLGEKFSVNPTNGTGSLSVPLHSSPGRSGFGPRLSLTYDSGAGNGPFGFGWSLSLPAITRKTDKGLPRYRDGDESDVFLLSGAEDLVPVLNGAGQRVSFPRTVHGMAYQIHLYRPRIEGLFTRIERWNRVDDGTSHWRTITRDNVTTIFGRDTNSRVADPRDPRRVFSYLICRTFDDKGNIATYDYAEEDLVGVNTLAAHEAHRTPRDRQAQRYLRLVQYGNAQPYFPDWSPGGAETALPAGWHFSLVLDYGDHAPDAPVPTPDRAWPVRPDPFSSYRAGFEVRTYRRCERVLMFHQFAGQVGFDEPCLVYSTDLTYSDETTPADPRNPIYTFLESVTQRGYRRTDEGYVQRSSPPLEFFYSQPQLHPEVLTLADADSRENLPEGLDGTRFRLVDLDGEGLPGILTEQDGGWGYKRNLSPINQVTLPGGQRVPRARFAPLVPVASLPAPASLDGGQQLIDLSGDGQLDLVAFDGPTPGFFERTTVADWEPYRPFTSLPHLNWAEANVRFVDLTGDGLADVLLTDDDVHTFYPSLGESGFGEAERVVTPWDEARGPRVVFADGTQTVSLADLSGDGLSDLVRVRNGEVCYWPNLGYGKFGPRVTMDAAPRFTDDARFDPRRVRFADVDGSGTTDLLYIGDDGVQVCFNRSGNSWATAQRLTVFPSADDMSSVQVTDLLGTGTACLVWSSPSPAQSHAPLRYVDLMGSVKPHLLVRIRNNLGSETRLAYAPSTRFYLEDQRAGRSWITRLPFPVQVVERVETYDWIGRSRFVTRYAYHHGYFDGKEREFRGFGMVDQWDTETHRGDTLFPDVVTTNEDAASLVPPVRTRTWFHTGACIEAAAIARQYEREYWVEPALRGDDPAHVAARRAMLLPDAIFEAPLAGDELREAHRALKGSVLRVEVYAEDGTARAEHPYTVTEQNFSVRRLQARGPNQHAIFLTHARESLVYHYERRPADPRLSHELTLEVDEFGHVCRSASVGYPRRPGHPEPEPNVSAAFRTMLAHDQSRLHVSGTEQVWTLPDRRPTDAVAFDAYRAPLPAEVITAELTGIAPTGARFGLDELDAHWTVLWGGVHDVPYEDVSTPDVQGTGMPLGLARRVVERTRTLYRRDDLTGLLPLRGLEPEALPGETFKLALTPGLIARVFGPRVTDAILIEGGYVRPPGQPDWWIPSGRLFFSPDAAAPPAQELAEAQAHFYQVRRAVDPFGAASRVTYDAYDLLPRMTTDAMGNQTTADNDYRVLHPFRITDPNGHFTEAAFDCLGEVIATAVRGAAGEGDALTGFDPDLDEGTVLAVRANPLANPAALLGEATSRLVIDEFAYFRTRDDVRPQPPMVYTVTRETHVSELAPGQQPRYHHLCSYSDGFGREAQQKSRAEPGPVAGVGDDVNPRWVGTGWTIYNNKGKPVRKYEPFFSSTHEFEFDQLRGVSSVLFYDPIQRTVGTLHPDNTWGKAVLDAWRQEAWDANDTVLIGDPRTDLDVGEHFQRLLGGAPGAFTSWHDRRAGGTFGATPEERAASQDAAQKAAAHAATPTVAHLDALGRVSLNVSDNGTAAGVPQRYPLRAALDAESKPLAVFDARGRTVMEFCLREAVAGGGFRYVAGYDLDGNPLYRNGMDGGERRTLHDVMGKPLRTWDARGFTFVVRYDALRRPTHRFIGRAGFGEILVERMIYGERHPDAARNLRGRLYRHYDGAGVSSNERYDFKGNMLESRRQFTRDYRTTPDWTLIADVPDAPALDPVALDATTATLLRQDDAFTALSRYDALNRAVQVVTPHRAIAPADRPSVIQTTYNEANLLERIDVWIRRAARPAALLDPATADVPAVTGVTYNARAQRTRVEYGNGAVTESAYDPETFRLVGLVTTRAHPDPDARTVQALAYQYDPVGNITRLRDTADIQNVVYFRNQRVDPSADYTYDALYRLTSASGREHLGQTGGALNAASQATDDDVARIGLVAPADGNAMGRYTEQYIYDPVGNILQMIHQVASGGWTRRYAYMEPSLVAAAETSNRLSATSLPGDNALGPYSAVYQYDAHGNVTRMPHLPLMTWDEQDRPQSTARQQVNAGTPETTYYNYDATGERLRKVTDGAAGPGQDSRPKTEQLYLGVFELYREYSETGAVIKERETLDVLLDNKRVALLETRTVDTQGDDPSPPRLDRYQFGNHLGSVALELDDQAAVISYEEYFPYGATSYQGVRSLTETPKRYRYTGKERDQETALNYHGARYYAPWLGRWTACDQAGLADGANLYAYVQGNPVRLSDPTGLLTWGQWAGIGAAIVVGTAVTVLTAGAAGPLVGAAAATIIGGIVGGAAGGAVGEVVEAAVDRRPITAGNVVRAAAVGAAIGGAVAAATVGVAAAATAVAGTAVARAVASRVASSALGRTVAAGTARVAGAVASAGRTAAGRAVVAAGRVVSRAGAALRDPAERFGQRIAERLGAGPGARLAAAAQARAAATQLNVQGAAGVSRATVSASEGQTLSHSVGWRGGGVFGPEVTGAQVEAQGALRLSPGGVQGQWGEGAYAFAGPLQPGQAGTAFQFRVPPQTAVETVNIPGGRPVVRLVPPPGQDLVPIRITGTNFPAGALEQGNQTLNALGIPRPGPVRFGYPGVSPDTSGLPGGVGHLGNVLIGPSTPTDDRSPVVPSVGVHF